MFNIFKKKEFLIDNLAGFTDMHCHILPGIDDGAKNLRESIRLIKMFSQYGITNFIATPHIMGDTYPNDKESIELALTQVKNNLQYYNFKDVNINYAAEYMMDEEFENLLDQKNILPLKDKYILVEMSYFQPPINLIEVIENIRNKGYLPVLAHPERYIYYHNSLKTYTTLRQMGCFFQLNLLSLSEYYGEDIQKTALTLLQENLIDFVGTDTHHSKHLKALATIKITKKLKNDVLPIIENTSLAFSFI